MAKKSKSRRRSSGGGSLSMVELVGPAATALFGPKILLNVQKPEEGKEKDDKTALILAGGAWYLSKGRYKKYAPMALVLAAMAHRRKLALSGELNTDGEDMITAETAKETE